MKQCPDCAARNQETNLFCPICGYSFIDDPAGDDRARDHEKNRARFVAGIENSKLPIIVTVVIVVALGLGAGITSYVACRQIERNAMLPVKSGTLWNCSKCGRIYKNRVRVLDVKKSERDNYFVETAMGLCDTCKYGELVGRYQNLLEYFFHKGYFGGFTIDIAEPAAAFMNSHQELFPTTEKDRIAEYASPTDPALIERDYAEYVGKPVFLTGKALAVEIVNTPSGGNATFVRLQPTWENKALDMTFFVVYQGRSPVAKGDTIRCCLLPVDLIAYRSKSENVRIVLSIAIHMAR